MIHPLAGVLDPGRGSAAAAAAAGLPDAHLGDDVEVTVAGALVVGTSSGCGGAEGVLCAIDGAVHNRAELAASLGLDPESPPESILAHGYHRWGSELASRLRGEFAALVWEEAGQRGLLIQDQMGVKRLFVRREGERLWFGSDVRNVLAILPTRPAPDPVAISHWLARSPAPHGATLYEGISALESGRMVVLEDGSWETRRYWHPEYREPLDVPHEELIDRIRGVLRRSVERRTTPGAPTGVLLSGGLDSTSVAALAQESPGGAYGFSTTVPDYPHIDESRWIDALEDHIDLPGVHLAARGGGILASGVDYLRHWELPLSAWSEAWTQPLLREAPGVGVTTILSGEGGDELFGSRFMFTADLMCRGRLLAAFNFARGLPEAGGRAPRDVLAHVLWKFGLQGVPPAWLESAWRSVAVWDDPAPWWANRETSDRMRQSRPPSWRRADEPRWWAFLTDALTSGVHGFGLFDHVRRRTEQLGLEARHPLFDLELFDLMLQIPPERFSEGDLTRPLFREAMAGLTPDEVRLRPDKSVFNDLIVDALVGPELPALSKILGEATEIGAYADPAAIAELLENRPPAQRGYVFDWAQDVLRLAAVEIWLRFQEDRTIVERLAEDQILAAPRHEIELRRRPLSKS